MMKEEKKKETINVKEENLEEKFVGDGVMFKAKYIGVHPVANPRGDDMCHTAMSTLKAMAKGKGSHKQRINIFISLNGIKLVDEKTNEVIEEQPVSMISYISRDVGDTRAFGFVHGSPENGHRFTAIKTEKLALPVMKAIGELFTHVYESKKKEKQRKHQQHNEHSSTNAEKQADEIVEEINFFSVDIPSSSTSSIKSHSAIVSFSDDEANRDANSCESTPATNNTMNSKQRRSKFKKQTTVCTDTGVFPTLPLPKSSRRNRNRGHIYSIDETPAVINNNNNNNNNVSKSNDVFTKRNDSESSFFNSSEEFFNSTFNDSFAPILINSTNTMSTTVNTVSDIVNNSSATTLSTKSVLSNEVKPDRYAAFLEIENIPSIFDSVNSKANNSSKINDNNYTFNNNNNSSNSQLMQSTDSNDDFLMMSSASTFSGFEVNFDESFWPKSKDKINSNIISNHNDNNNKCDSNNDLFTTNSQQTVTPLTSLQHQQLQQQEQQQFQTAPPKPSRLFENSDKFFSDLDVLGKDVFNQLNINFSPVKSFNKNDEQTKVPEAAALSMSNLITTSTPLEGSNTTEITQKRSNINEFVDIDSIILTCSPVPDVNLSSPTCNPFLSDTENLFTLNTENSLANCTTVRNDTFMPTNSNQNNEVNKINIDISHTLFNEQRSNSPFNPFLQDDNSNSNNNDSNSYDNKTTKLGNNLQQAPIKQCPTYLPPPLPISPPPVPPRPSSTCSSISSVEQEKTFSLSSTNPTPVLPLPPHHPHHHHSNHPSNNLTTAPPLPLPRKITKSENTVNSRLTNQLTNVFSSNSSSSSNSFSSSSSSSSSSTSSSTRFELDNQLSEINQQLPRLATVTSIAPPLPLPSRKVNNRTPTKTSTIFPVEFDDLKINKLTENLNEFNINELTMKSDPFAVQVNSEITNNNKWEAFDTSADNFKNIITEITLPTPTPPVSPFQVSVNNKTEFENITTTNLKPSVEREIAEKRPILTKESPNTSSSSDEQNNFENVFKNIEDPFSSDDFFS